MKKLEHLLAESHGGILALIETHLFYPAVQEYQLKCHAGKENEGKEMGTKLLSLALNKYCKHLGMHWIF